MYGFCQMLDMPTTPGIKWTKKKSGFYKKEIMSNNHSFECQQWLEWKQETDPFLIDADGRKTQIQMKYYRGEIKIYNSKTKDNSWPVDGFAKTNTGTKIYEYLGERFHSGCPYCSDKKDQDEQWLRKKADIARLGYKLEYIWSCQWRKIRTKLKAFETPRLPRILKTKDTEELILKGIMDETLFGYIVCDVRSPENIVRKWKIFPPVIKRATLNESHLTEFTKTQVEKEYNETPTSTFKRTTLIQCFNDDQHLLFTPLARFYIQEGLELSNISIFIQYHPNKCLKPFIDKCTKMRIEAEKKSEQLKGNTAKIIGNAGYGVSLNI